MKVDEGEFFVYEKQCKLFLMKIKSEKQLMTEKIMIK